MDKKMTNLKNSFNRYGILTAVLLLIQAPAALAWPTKSLQMLVGYPAGGSADVLGRAFGEALSARLGQSVVVVNRDGASGTIAMAAGAKAVKLRTTSCFEPALKATAGESTTKKPTLPVLACELFDTI